MWPVAKRPEDILPESGLQKRSSYSPITAHFWKGFWSAAKRTDQITWVAASLPNSLTDNPSAPLLSRVTEQ